MKKTIGIEAWKAKREYTAKETAEMAVQTVSNLSWIVESTNYLLDELIVFFKFAHRDFGSWEEFLTKVPNETRSELIDMAEKLQNGHLDDFWALSGVIKLILDRFLGGEKYTSLREKVDQWEGIEDKE
jgi:hypothetical protein